MSEIIVITEYHGRSLGVPVVQLRPRKVTMLARPALFRAQPAAYSGMSQIAISGHRLVLRDRRIADVGTSAFEGVRSRYFGL
jgi:hypothetical protein